METAPKGSRREPILLFLCVAVVLVTMMVITHVASTFNATRHLDNTIERWRTQFNLNASQAEQVRTLERSFHGSGSPFNLPSHTIEELKRHQQDIAAIMNPEDAKRFLHAQTGHKKHP